MALLASACSGGPAPGRVLGPGQAIHPCALLTTSDVEAALGRLHDSPELSSAGSVNAPFTSCDWLGTRGNVVVSVATDASFRALPLSPGETHSDAARFATIPGRSVSGLGVPAKLYSSAPAPNQNPPTGFFQVALLTKPALVLINISSSDDPSSPAKLVQLAREALPALSP